VRTEILAGVTTFTTMAYIIVVNPAILAFAGLPTGPSTVATILAAAFGSIAMGLYANRPFAVAPYMGENAFIAFGLAALGITWTQRLGAVFWGGLLFAIITLLRVRPWLAAAISPSLKHSFAVGIGLFLALIGLYESGIVTSFVTGLPPGALAVSPAGGLLAPGAPLKLGDVREPRVLLAVAGFVLMAVLLQRGIRGAILLGMAATAAAGIALGLGPAPQAVIAIPFRGDYSLAPVALHLDLLGVLEPRLLPVLLTLFLMGFLDTLGTLVALGSAASLLDEEGNLAEIEKPMMVDAATCMLSGSWARPPRARTSNRRRESATARGPGWPRSRRASSSSRLSSSFRSWSRCSPCATPMRPRWSSWAFSCSRPRATSPTTT
jgi:AGZA family xanthine/uracil permease-like MFS transporter